MFQALKAFFCSNIKSVFQRDSQLQAVKAWYAFLWRLKLHAFNYTAITYSSMGVQS